MNNKIARITWNDKGWKYPSGRKNKSLSLTTFEGENRYGHDEWLFDTKKIIGGFHYGFIQPIRRNQDFYKGKILFVKLFSINSRSKERYFIGEISEVIVIDEAEAEFIKTKYFQYGWLEEMKNQIHAVDGKSQLLEKLEGINIFNVKFQINNLKESKVKIPADSKLYKIHRYKLIDFF
jgi:hypothetical protein